MSSKTRQIFLSSSWAICFHSLAPTYSWFYLPSTNIAGRDKNREKQGATAGGFPLVGLQGAYAGAANEGRSQEARLSEGGLGSGECIAVVGGLHDIEM